MDATLLESVRQLAADARSGASELLPRAFELLRTARGKGRPTLIEAARAVCAAQPSMGSFWNAAAAALAALDGATDALDAMEQRARRAGPALQRVAVDTLLPSPRARPADEALRVTTCSFSGTVLGVVRDLALRVPVTVHCAEGRPALEGRRLAIALADDGIPVDFYTDAGVSVALSRSHVVLVGADAVAPEWFLNKCGTLALAAAASTLGVPVYVLASRDKFVPPALAGLLAVVDHDPEEVWPGAPPAVSIRNPYFERIPLALVSALVTDAGCVGADAAAEICRASGVGVSADIVEDLRPR